VDDVTDAIQRGVTQYVRRRARVIEEACERALTGGVCGVSVYDDVVMVDLDVPYGMIHYHESRWAEGDHAARRE
jgi:hypothetical protein